MAIVREARIKPTTSLINPPEIRLRRLIKIIYCSTPSSLGMALKSFEMLWFVGALRKYNGRRYQRMRLPITQISQSISSGSQTILTTSYIPL